MDVIIPSGTVMRPVVPSSVNIEHIVLKDQDGSIIDYLHPEAIEGFEYTKGFEYVLRLKRTTIDNPPADGSCYSYSLIKILSQKNMSDSL
ncbi:hypothetical protein FACS1894169_00440 [Bacteroidia bacterium]|nr:hypothetical protein FACS1894169_00440 [Bacteroidia bacterium]